MLELYDQVFLVDILTDTGILLESIKALPPYIAALFDFHVLEECPVVYLAVGEPS
jgi:hypothetical protein